MLPILLLALPILVAVLLVVVVRRPADFRVSRSATIAAPPSVIFALINDLHQWEKWSPWAKLDPAAQTTFSGAPAGASAVMAWAGNNQVGSGSMTIIESRPPELVRLRLDFLKPFQATNTAEFVFQPQFKQTLVTWSMTGKYNFISKAMSLVISMDQMIGGNFEKGLVDLKSIAEASNKK